MHTSNCWGSVRGRETGESAGNCAPEIRIVQEGQTQSTKTKSRSREGKPSDESGLPRRQDFPTSQHRGYPISLSWLTQDKWRGSSWKSRIGRGGNSWSDRKRSCLPSNLSQRISEKLTLLLKSENQRECAKEIVALFCAPSTLNEACVTRQT